MSCMGRNRMSATGNLPDPASTAAMTSRSAPPVTNGLGTHATAADTNLAPPNLANGHHAPQHDARSALAPPANAAMPNKKGKQKKGVDSDETSKLLAARISQLEIDAAGEKDQEAEIEREVKKAQRELGTQTAKMNELAKIEYLNRKCSELLADMKRLERESIKQKKRNDQVQKEKDTTRTELTKTTTLKDKLEKLCRELQKENNKLKNETKQLSDTLAKHTNSWDEKYSAVLSKLDNYQEDKDNPRKQVVDMEISELFRERFKSFIDQYELRELHFHSQMRTKELEVQLNLARYERAKKELDGELARVKQLNTQIQTFSKTEAELRQQLTVYVDKFKQVEDTLNNSNDLFVTFRKEMEDMSKKTKRLEKENKVLKRKHEALTGNVSKMSLEREKHEKEIDELKKKDAKLSGIIKQMQQQGRGIPPGLMSSTESKFLTGQGGLEEDESEYEDEYDEDGDEGLSAEGEEYDDETEDELQPEVPYGPERPPPAPTTIMNGHR